MLGTQFNKDKELLAFAYWIPSDYYELKGSLVDILEIFTNQFGLKIKTGDKEGYLIRYSELFIIGKIEDPNALITILAPDQIPCEYFIFSSENLIQSLNHVSIYYAFAINRGKYYFWLYSFPTIKLEIKSGWYEFVKNNFVDFIQPNGQTKIKIQKQKSTEGLECDSNNSMTTIDVPSMYGDQFQHIAKQINGLRNNEKIIFSMSFESQKCFFCQSDDISKEHIFPKWLRPYLEETTFDGMLLSNFGNESIESIMRSASTQGKKESSHGYTEKLVCKYCNNNWMSQLENEVKAILVNDNKLIDNISSDISINDAETLSVWLIVKALLLTNKSISNIHMLNKQIFENLKSRKIDSGFLVETVNTDNPRFGFVIGKGLIEDRLIRLKKIPLEKGVQMTTNFFNCSIQLNRLLFRISYLEPSLSFKRETALKQTLKLFPFGENINHIQFIDDVRIWENVVTGGVELHIFNMLGLSLVEKD